MLVICNGAIKSGSTWLYKILTNLRSFSPPADEYLTLRNPRHACIRPDRLEEFLRVEDYVSNDYLSKNHFDKAEHRDLLMSRQQVYVFDIERDPKDVVVSHFYHEQFRNHYEGSFADFYWSVGRETIAGLSKYHALWRDVSSRVYISSYERLHTEFDSEVKRIGAVLGLHVSVEQAISIRERTSIGSLRKEYENEPRFEGDKFFRKGAIGDWRNHLDDEMLQDIQRIAVRGLRPLDLPRIRHRLKHLRRRP